MATSRGRLLGESISLHQSGNMAIFSSKFTPCDWLVVNDVTAKFLNKIAPNFYSSVVVGLLNFWGDLCISQFHNHAQ